MGLLLLEVEAEECRNSVGMSVCDVCLNNLCLHCLCIGCVALSLQSLAGFLVDLRRDVYVELPVVVRRTSGEADLKRKSVKNGKNPSPRKKRKTMITFRSRMRSIRLT